MEALSKTRFRPLLKVGFCICGMAYLVLVVNAHSPPMVSIDKISPERTLAGACNISSGWAAAQDKPGSLRTFDRAKKIGSRTKT
jgi:hypothetical protein